MGEDFRGFLDAMEETKEDGFIRIKKEVDTRYEVAAIVKKLEQTKKIPTAHRFPLFYSLGNDVIFWQNPDHSGLCPLDFCFQALFKCHPGILSQKIRSSVHRQQRLMFLSLAGMFCEYGADTPCETDTTN